MKWLTAMFLTVPALALAEPQPWMKKEDPNELAFAFSYGAPCNGVSGESVSRTAQDVIVRSRIKVAPLMSGKRYLLLRLWCTESGGLFLYRFDIDIAMLSSKHGLIRFGESSRGGYGLNDAEGLTADIKTRTESFVADYLRANFDLDDND